MPDRKDIYVTIQGDTWDLILYKIHGAGAELEMDKLIMANPQHRNIMFFSSGVQLSIPDLTNPFIKQAVPPWQR